MEMEGSRRSIDRSREPGLKKPRLDEGGERDRGSNSVIDRGRPFPQRVASGAIPATGDSVSRFRANERERIAEKQDSVQGIHQQQQHHQELINQYKAALTELTFNSKPIITNLTIIAGENLHAAKWITATVCANILEVPSEQKLPSLYLLDSIVKNIGGDYIKYFSARLPEVFCKAYRQVDSAIHPGMRHLFGTWKGVFPPASLQMIEKELGFPPSITVSSSGAATSRLDSQSPGPPHSIHVNPKYLEARQRLQQSSKDTGPPQREASSEPLHEKKSSARYEVIEYGSDLSRHSGLVTGRACERANEQDGHDQPWYGSSSNAAEAIIGRSSVFDRQDGFSKYQATKSAQFVSRMQPTHNIGNRSTEGMNKNWKNSEEEEYVWDDVNSRLTDHGVPDSLSVDGWTPDDAEKPVVEEHLLQIRGEHDIGSRINRETSSDSLYISQRGQAAFRHQISSMCPSQEPQSVDGLKHISITSRSSGHSEGHPTSFNVLSTSMSSSIGRTGFQTLIMGPSVDSTPNLISLVNKGPGSDGFLGQQDQLLRPASPSGQLPMHQHPLSPSYSALFQHQEFHSFTGKDHLQTQSSQPKTSQLAGQLNQVPHIQITRDSFPIKPQSHIQSGTLQNLQSIQSQPLQHKQTSIQMPFPQPRHHGPFLQKQHPELKQSQPSGQMQKPLPQSSISGSSTIMGHSASGHSNNIGVDTPGQTSTDSLLAAIMKSGLLSNNSVNSGLPNPSFKYSGVLSSHLSAQLPLPSWPPQLTTSSSPMVTPAPVLGPTSHGSTSSHTKHPHRTDLLPPLPPGPSPAVSLMSGAMPSQTSDVANGVPNPLSSLLSTLVAKGLISSQAKEMPTLTSPQAPSQLQNQSPGLNTCSFMPVSSNPSSSTIPTSSGNGLLFTDSASKGTTTLSEAMKIERDLIGIEFKPEIIREFHPSVIRDLFDDLRHQCSTCGHRLKHQEQLDRHLEWHASKNPGPNGCKRISRRWYANWGDWVAGSEWLPSGPKSTGSVEGLAETAEKGEPVVPADEGQCVCMLCGEPFEDFYCHERDEWMYKGATYMSVSAMDGKIGTTDETAAQGPIVHTNCISPTSVYDLGLSKNIKLEQADG